MMTKKDDLTGADLFCGMGSFHLAMKAFAIKTVHACDTNPSVRATYERNHDLVPVGDIRDVHELLPDLAMVCAGFPCQPYSTNGKRRGIMDNVNGDLLQETLKLIALWRPKTCLLENVPGFLSWDSGRVWRDADNVLWDLGYSTVWLKLDCADWGIPQHRERVFGLAVRHDLLLSPSAPPLEPDLMTASETMPSMVTPTLGAFLGDPTITRDVCRTLRCRHKTVSLFSSGNWDWSHYERTDGSYHKITLAEGLALQGFNPDTWRWVCSENQAWRMVGNTVPLTLACIAMSRLMPYLVF